MPRTGYAVIAVVVVLGAGVLALRPLFRNAAAADGAVVVLADMAGFRPGEIRARAGEQLTVRLESLDTRFHTDGGGRHQFAIDELGVDLIAPPLGAVETTFVVPEAGVYRFYCSVCCGGKSNPGMWGRLIVTS